MASDATADSSVAQQEDETQGREVLPTSVTPEHYFVSYSKVDLEDPFKFYGTVTIDVNINDNTKTITVNSEDLEWNENKVTYGNNKCLKVTFVEKTGQATIEFEHELEKGTKGQLKIGFIGNLNDKMKGFYRSKYKLGDGKDAFAGVTQFESTDARRAFPCWDEPAAKATFCVEMTYPSSLVCLSNTEPEQGPTDNNNGTSTVRFAKTPKMSTYLLAWAIGEFEYVESKTSKNNINVRVYTTMGNKDKGIFALEVGCLCLDFYEEYFGIPYPLSKCDMIAVPDFAAGAMENWGLITYREIALLCDKPKASLKQKQYIAIVVCHELAHQWFGNLVTMDWWSQLWLNEGFACFMEYLSSDSLFKNWKMWNLFITSEYMRAYELDGMLSSHPIETNVKTAAEAEEVFDAISYCKGACVIRMLQTYLGPQIFRTALSKYLNKFQYNNAITTDLWTSLSNESGKNVSDIMANWTSKQGFPLISVKKNEDNTITISQRRYLSSSPSDDDEKKNDNDNNDNNTIWTIPISVRIEGSSDLQSILLTKNTQIFGINDIKGIDIKNNKWIHLNANSTGFYVVEYGDSLLTNLTIALSKNDVNLNEVDRLCLVRDAKALSSCGTKGATKQLLSLIKACNNTISYPLWDVIISSAADIAHLIDGEKPIINNFNIIMQNVLTPIYNKLGWESKEDEEDETTSGLLRPLILNALGKYEHEDVKNEALKRFRAFSQDSKNLKLDEIPSSLKSTIFSLAMKFGNEKDFSNLKLYYLNAKDPADKTWSLRALGLTRDKDCINNLLEWILNDDKEVRKQDKVFPFRTVSHTLAGRDIAWKFLQDNWTKWMELFGGGFLVQHLAKIPSGYVSKEKADEIQKFYDSLQNVDACKRAMKQCVETIRESAQWKTISWNDITSWVSDEVKTLTGAKE